MWIKSGTVCKPHYYIWVEILNLRFFDTPMLGTLLLGPMGAKLFRKQSLAGVF